MLIHESFLFISTVAENAEVNGEANGDAPSHKKWDVITITGRKENCEGAKEALLVRFTFPGLQFYFVGIALHHR